jgi:hypothetical protein
MRVFFVCLFCGLPTFIFAQPVVLQQDTAMFWAGGFNSPQIQTMDLNQDGRQDVVVFDRTTSRFFTFLQPPQSKKLLYAPSYEKIFPKTQGWFLLRDYNQDGIKDFFAHVPSGLQGWKAAKTAQGIAFQEFAGKGIRTKGLSGDINLQIGMGDIPCLADFDDDKDLDVLTFDFMQGNFLEFHLNTSPTPAEIRLEKQGFCWGNLWEGMNCGELRFDYPCEKAGRGGGENYQNTEFSFENKRIAHAGSSLTMVDLNQDKKLDLLVGDVSCRRLYAIYNKGTNLKPQFVKYDTLFPASKPVDMHIFPASFVEDVNFDGVPDLLVAPNTFINEANKIDFQHSLWLYTGKKKGKKIQYEFQRQDFLQNQMLEVGENASPALWDYDQDGDFDLLVGNRGLEQAGKFRATIHLFENIGNAQKPNFQLKTNDYLSLSQKNWTDIQLFITDSNQDSKSELHVLAYANRKRVWYYKTQSEANWTSFPFDLQARQFPILADFDKDNDLDLLLSLPFNEWKYWENTTQNTSFRWKEGTPSMNLPALPTSFMEQFGAFTDLNADQQKDLVLCHEGNIWLYSDVQSQWAGKERWLGDKNLFFNNLAQQFYAHEVGIYAFPAFADLDADGRIDMVVGLGTGGVSLFWNKATP